MITAATLLTVMAGLMTVTKGEYTTARMYQKHYPEYDHYSDPIPVTEPETDHYYHPSHSHRYRQPPSEKGLDLTSLGILAIIKLLLIKIKGMGLGLLLLMKLPVILFTFLGKFLFFFKVAKVLKLLALPLLLVALLPLLLIPLLLLAPLLLPLLLALPIPVLQPANNAAAAGRRRRDTRRLLLLQNLIESEHCLERMACILASEKPTYSSTISWGLNRLKSHIAHPKLSSYAEAYKESTEKKMSRSDCRTKYPCDHLQLKKLPSHNSAHVRSDIAISSADH